MVGDLIQGKGSGSYVHYELLDKDGKVLRKSPESTGSDCYRNVSQNTVQQEGVLFKTWFPINCVPYEEETIVEWIKEINELGFPVKYEGIKDEKFFSFSLDLELFKNRWLFNSGLILTRYVYEMGFNKIPHIYFEIRKELPDSDKMAALLLAHQYVKGNSNHMLRSYDKGMKIFTLDVFKEKLAKETQTIYEKIGYFQTSAGKWNADILGAEVLNPSHLNTYEKAYNKLLIK